MKTGTNLCIIICIICLIFEKLIPMNVIDRIKADTPKYFKTIRKWCLAIAGASSAAMACSYAVDLPEWMTTVFHDGVILGVVGTFLSSLTTHNEQGTA